MLLMVFLYYQRNDVKKEVYSCHSYSFHYLYIITQKRDYVVYAIVFRTRFIDKDVGIQSHQMWLGELSSRTNFMRQLVVSIMINEV